MLTAWILAVMAVLGMLAGIGRLLVLTGRLVERVDEMDRRLVKLEAAPARR